LGDNDDKGPLTVSEGLVLSLGLTGRHARFSVR